MANSEKILREQNKYTKKNRTEQLKRDDKEKNSDNQLWKSNTEFQKERKNKMEKKYEEVSPKKTVITSVQISNHKEPTPWTIIILFQKNENKAKILKSQK